MIEPGSGNCVCGAKGFALGRQETIEFYDCDPAKLADAALMEEVFVNAAWKSGATVINSNFHQFVPQGVSGVVIISESHFAVHAWPEHEYAAVDLFTCGDSVNFDRAVEVIAEGIASKQYVVSSLFNRGIVGNNGVERMVPVMEEQKCHSFQLSWKSRCEETRARGISCAMDICDCNNLDFSSEKAVEGFVSAFLKKTELVPSGKLAVVPGEKGWSTFVQLLDGGSLSGAADSEKRTVYLDLFVKGFADPRNIAETAVTLLEGAYYRMQPQVRI
ncbi:MAG: adenosylmethionine decarboxylase [Lentisphaeria bacterium]|nr:adenosylmethionine decarboxylase [Lentisphaeria bacterium]